MKIAILDGYVDEPTCLGVPPFISPYVRYLAGALWASKQKSVYYYTIDQLRQGCIPPMDLIIVIAGVTVPGKYLGGMPATLPELVFRLGELKGTKILTGPLATHIPSRHRGLADTFEYILQGDAELALATFFRTGDMVDTIRASASQIQDFAVQGASIVRQHPNYPHVITEIETYRGCPRALVGGCTFCTEPFKGLPDFREEKDIVKEVQSLYRNGIRFFRLGNQPDLFCYKARGVGEQEFPQPNPGALKKLYHGIRAVAPHLETLHMDNANPGTLAHHPQESTEIAKIIIQYHTPGDVAALGIESVDPEVIKHNNLKVSPDEAMDAIELLNTVGARRGNNGLPELLPGLNFIFGLPRETKKTYELNYQFLETIKKRNLLVRRINLRQVITVPKTRNTLKGQKKVRKRYFREFKEKIRLNIDQPLLMRMVPPGTLLRDLYAEAYEGKVTLLRHLGTYPLLVGVTTHLPLHHKFHVMVTSHGYRSVTGVPFPLNINTASLDVLKALPAIGGKRAQRIICARPFTSTTDLLKALDDEAIAHSILPYITLETPGETRKNSKIDPRKHTGSVLSE